MTAANILTDEQIKAAAPAAFTAEGAPHMSGKYGVIDTMGVVDKFIEQGFYPVQAKQDQPQRRDPRYVRHCIVLRHFDDIAEEARVGLQVPQIMLINSHNGRTKLHMRAGLYRFICANGMVVGDDAMMSSLAHGQSASDIIGTFAEDFAGNVGDLHRTIDHWSGIELSGQRTNDFAREAAKLRFGSRADMFNPEDILEARREEDEGRTLWKVFNRAQENLTKGGIKGTTASNRATSAREIKGIGSDIAINQQLWSLASDFAEAA